MMKTIDNLEFVDILERPKSNSIVVKRQRLLEGLKKQTSELKRYSDGHWSPKMWFWQDTSGKFFLELRYARKPLPLKEGKAAIQCMSLDDVGQAIEKLEMIVRAGELDQEILEASAGIRKRFKKSDGK